MGHFLRPNSCLGGLACSHYLVIPLRYETDRKSTRLNSSHGYISYAVFCLKKKKRVTADLLVSKKQSAEAAPSRAHAILVLGHYSAGCARVTARSTERHGALAACILRHGGD